LRVVLRNAYAKTRSLVPTPRLEPGLSLSISLSNHESARESFIREEARVENCVGPPDEEEEGEEEREGGGTTRHNEVLDQEGSMCSLVEITSNWHLLLTPC
jgi:hypothetical protein